MNGFSVRREPGGSRVIASEVPLGAYPATVCEDLVAWAAREPDAVFLAERSGGAWRGLTYGEALLRVRSLGAWLRSSGASAEAPLGVISENSIDHALCMLAALYVGIPVAPISAGYAAPESSTDRLRGMLDALAPSLVFAGDTKIAARISAADDGVRIVTDPAPLAGEASLADEAFSRVDGDTIAKIMFTSGSTGKPKGVITTNRMLCANQAMIAMVWPEIDGARPVAVDWLPWSHCFGGNHNFGIVLHNGGTLYIDEGRPAPGAFNATLRNLAEFPPAVFFSVPRGYVLLVEALHADAAFAATFFSRLRVICNAGASLPDALRRDIIALAKTYGTSSVRVTSSWGTTETAPLATTSWGTHEPDVDTIGTPAPGVEIKLAPSDGRAEIRVRGPNVTPGYWRNVAATRDAFDAEGFYKTGDAAELKDESDAARGLLFGGRLAENFKLSSGTWVNVGALRLSLVERGAPLIEDVVVAGHDRDEIAVLIFVSRAHAARLAGASEIGYAEIPRQAIVRDRIAEALGRHNASAPSSSTRVARALILTEPPSREAGEITDKGSINQRRALELRALAVQTLYAEDSGSEVVTAPALRMAKA
jgi:feruloyl-CoA synthase